MISAEKRFWRDYAARAVASAKRFGNLPEVKRMQCRDCGKKATDYDHRDYLDALNVTAVCRSCNLRRGPAWFPAWIDGRSPYQDYKAACGLLWPNGYYAKADPFKKKYMMHFPEIAVKARQAQLTAKRIHD